MESLIPIIEYLITIINLLLGLVIFSRGFKNLLDILFGLIALTSATWSSSILFFYLSSGEIIQIINEIPRDTWIILSHVSALLIPILSLFFSFNFPDKIKIPIYVKIAILIPGAYLLLNIIQGQNIIGAPNNLSYEIGSMYGLYLLGITAYFFANYITLFFQYRHSNREEEKKQVAYILYGIIVSSSLAIVPNLILPYIKIFTYTWLGPVFTIIFVITIFITILKFKLFKIKVIVTELFAGLIIILLLTEIIYSTTPTELVLKTMVIILVAVSSFLLTKSVYKEVESREEIERLAKDLATANTRLKELDQMKTEFLSLASHQIRSPLSAIKGYASLILDGSFGKTPPAIHEAVDKIFQASQSLVIMVEDFLNISRIEQGRMKYDFASTDIKDLIEKVLAEQKPSVDRAGLTLSFSTDNQAPYFANVDIGKMKQVITNIVDNAIKYTPKGGISVSLTKNTKDSTLQISIADTGVGIEPSTIPALFEKFVRAKDANKVNVLGTGLGLYIVKQMVDAHKGRVWVESEGVGKGSVFHVELSLDKDYEHAKKVSEFAKSMS